MPLNIALSCHAVHYVLQKTLSRSALICPLQSWSLNRKGFCSPVTVMFHSASRYISADRINNNYTMLKPIKMFFCSLFVCSVQFCLALVQFSLKMTRTRARRWLTGFVRWSKWQTGRQRGRRWSWEECRLQGHFAQLQNNSTVPRGIKGHAEIYLRHLEMCRINLPGHTYTSQQEKCYPSILFYIILHSASAQISGRSISYFVVISRRMMYYLTAAEVLGWFKFPL